MGGVGGVTDAPLGLFPGALILGIDPGTRATGYGAVRYGRPRHELVECGVTRPRGHNLAERIVDLHEEIGGLIDRLEPTCTAIEAVFSGRNPRTALVMGHARGVILLAAASRNLPIWEYSPAEIKKRIAGTGAATKGQIGFMVKHHLDLVEPPAPDDAADGCAVALCHALAATSPAVLGRR
ncbi:MAG: crossover junction endodeoxyribonuclease RuvC [Gemmatimonadetes bacterium]|nr:crossover junction endodeoxyribonuclease RuvC [Gemmatimonadota bacterium]